MRGWAVGLVAACAAASAACTPTFEDGSELDDHPLSPADHQVAPAELVATEGKVHALAAQGGALFIGTDSGLWMQRGSDAPLQLQPRVLDPGEPTATGAVHAIAERPNGQLLVAADAGVFVWDHRELLRSPMSDKAVSPVLVASGLSGTEERAAAVSKGELWWFGKDARRVVSAKVDGAPTAIAFQGGSLFAAYGEQIVRLDEGADGSLTQKMVLPSDGPVHALRLAADGSLWVATDESLLRRQVSGGVPKWDRWSTNEPILDVAPDPDGYGGWGRTRAGALFAPVKKEGSFRIALPGAPGPLLLDTDGNLWAGDAGDSKLWRQPGLGAPPPTFREDVGPFAQTYCVACHSATASLPLVTYDQWQRNGQRILLNLRVGTMPRGNPLDPGQYRVVERWIEGGLLP